MVHILPGRPVGKPDQRSPIGAAVPYRLARATSRPAGSGRTRTAPALIAGLIPQARGSMTAEMRQAITERRDLIEARADAVLDTALTSREPWTRALGTPPKEQQAVVRWLRDARIIAAYRDRYQITATSPLGPAPETDAQKLDHDRAQAALRRLTPKTKQSEPRQAALRRGGPDLGL